MNKIKVCESILFLLSLTLLQCHPIHETPKKPPNVIIIMADDQGWGDLSLNGNPIVSTPHIDSLARNGATLDRFYVSAVCSPTRASLLTGRYAVRGGVYSTSAGGERLDLDERTFAEVFQEAGYQTAAFGKWHNGGQPPYHPNSRGFDEFYGYCSGHWGSYFEAELEHNGELVSSEGFLTDVLTGRALDFITQHQNQPFLVYLPLNTPHSPMQVPDRWFQKFDTLDVPSHRYSHLENPEHTRAALAMAENIDWNVGRVAKLLDSLELDEETLVIYTSDNGPNGWRWNGEMEGIKGHVDEGGVRVPMLMYWPGKIDPGKSVPNISSVMDLYPTLLSLAGLKDTMPPKLDGMDISPWLTSDSLILDSNRQIVSYWKGKLSIRSDRYRLDHKNRLFDLGEDPAQTNDLKDSLPEIFAQHLETKENWEREVLSQLPKEDERRFTLGGGESIYTHFPARDATPHGEIQRSNRWPNCSFFTNWQSINDSLTWEIEVLEGGIYQPTIYYTCKPENVGSTLRLGCGSQIVETEVVQAFESKLRGQEHDRIPREESYVKDFSPLSFPPLKLKPGKSRLTLKAVHIPSSSVIDFRRLVMKRF